MAYLLLGKSEAKRSKILVSSVRVGPYFSLRPLPLRPSFTSEKRGEALANCYSRSALFQSSAAPATAYLFIGKARRSARKFGFLRHRLKSSAAFSTSRLASEKSEAKRSQIFWYRRSVFLRSRDKRGGALVILVRSARAVGAVSTRVFLRFLISRFL